MQIKITLDVDANVDGVDLTKIRRALEKHVSDNLDIPDYTLDVDDLETIEFGEEYEDIDVTFSVINITTIA